MSNEQPTRTPLGIQEFTHKDVTYLYDIDAITIEQATLAEEALQFKNEQARNVAENFNQIVESGGTVWFSNCVGALLQLSKDGALVPFTPMQWVAAKKFVQGLPAKEYTRLRACVEDFFHGTTAQSAVSYLFIDRSKKSSNKMLNAFMTKMIPTEQSSKK